MAFSCAECGYRSVKWYGRCPSCGAWDAFHEQSEPRGSDAAASSWIGEDPRSIRDIDVDELARIPSGSAEFDRVLSGGLIPGGVLLFGGEPGIGKSTLLLQTARSLAERQGNVLYVSGEESEGQIKLRASRLGIESAHLYVLSEQSMPRIKAAVEQLSPCALIVDSIQTVACGGVDGDVGSVRQLRAASAELTRLAKTRGMATILVGHITKDGAFAGPKTVEHLVDVAVYLEGHRGEDVRMLRTVKNRFGATHEVAVFQMTGDGLREISNPSTFFLDTGTRDARPGAVVVPVLEGTRPILIEMQALVAPTGGYGVPQRRCTGLDVNRVLLLLAVMDKRLAINVGGADVYLSVAGGLDVRERAGDVGVVAAVASSLRNRAVPLGTAVVGEVDLSGEVRTVRRLGERIREAEKLGYDRILVPAAGTVRASSAAKIVRVSSIDEVMAELQLD